MPDYNNAAETTIDNEDIDLSFYGDEDDDTQSSAENDKADTEESNTALAADSVEQTTSDNDNKSAADEKSSEEQPAPQQTTKQPQDTEFNREQARRRREAEEKERIATAESKARIAAVIDATGGENPYTHKPIVDASDVDQFLLMKKIEKDGGDPIADFPEYAKKHEQEHAAEAKAEAERVSERASDIEKFRSKYPDVDLQKLANDTQFDLFCGERIGQTPLVDLYESYIAFKKSVENEVQAQEKKTAIAEKAKATAAVGSLKDTTNPSDDGFYTMEQLKSMSDADMENNWDKVQKSLKHLNIK